MTDQKKSPNMNKSSNPKTPRRQNRGRGRPRQPGQQFGDSKQLSAPVAKTKQNRTPRPKMTTLPNGDCKIVHREYVQDIVAGVGTPSPFTIASLAINPGQVALFPWLSRIAANYESYSFNRLAFAYETEASTSLGGTMVLTVDYDASDAAPASKQQAMAYRSSVRTAPWTGVKHTSKPEDLHKNKTNFVRVGTQPANTDIKTYDVGNLFLISQGIGTSGATLGELYVEYSVVLMTPVYEPIATQVFGGTINGNTAMTAANPFGTAANLDPQSLGLAINAASGITFSQAGTYYFTLSAVGTGLTAFAATGATNIGSLFNGAATSGIATYRIAVTVPITVNVTMTATTVTTMFMQCGIAPDNSLA